MRRSPGGCRVRSVALVAFMLAASVVVGGGSASAAPTPVGLGTATTFAIRAGDAVTNVPTSTITGDVGLSPAAGTFYAGLTCAQVNAGAGPIYSTNGTGPPCPAAANAGLLTTVSNDA